MTFKDEFHDKIVAAYLSGMMMKEVAVIAGVSPTTVHRVLFQRGIKVRSTPRPKEKMQEPTPNHAEIIRLYLRGMNQTQIGGAMGFTKQYVSAVLRRWGVTSRQRESHRPCG